MLQKMVWVAWLQKTLNICEALSAESLGAGFMGELRSLQKRHLDSLRTIRFHKDIDPVTQDHIGAVRQHLRCGLALDYPKNGTGVDWMMAIGTVRAEAMRSYSLPRATTDAERQTIEEEIAEIEDASLSGGHDNGGLIADFRRDLQTIQLARVWMIERSNVGRSDL